MLQAPFSSVQLPARVIELARLHVWVVEDYHAVRRAGARRVGVGHVAIVDSSQTREDWYVERSWEPGV